MYQHSMLLLNGIPLFIKSPIISSFYLLWIKLQLVSISVGSTSTDSTKHGLKIYGGKFFQKVPKSKTWICHASNYLHSIHIVLSIIRNLEMIWSIKEDVCGLNVNATPFYIRDLSICGFWYSLGVLEPISHGYGGTTALWTFIYKS